MSIKAVATPGAQLLTPKDHTLLLIDLQSQMAFASHSSDPVALRNNGALIAQAAAGFEVPAILTVTAEKSLCGRMFHEIAEAFPGQPPLVRSTLNCWEDEALIGEVNRFDRDRLVFAGLWTSVGVADPVLSALDQGFEVYVVADACGDVSAEAHQRGLERMIQAGARPLTALSYLLELQRDWARADTYKLASGIARKFGGAYGLGIIYTSTMFGASET